MRHCPIVVTTRMAMANNNAPQCSPCYENHCGGRGAWGIVVPLFLIIALVCCLRKYIKRRRAEREAAMRAAMQPGSPPLPVAMPVQPGSPSGVPSPVPLGIPVPQPQQYEMMPPVQMLPVYPQVYPQYPTRTPAPQRTVPARAPVGGVLVTANTSFLPRDDAVEMAGGPVGSNGYARVSQLEP